MRVMTIRFGRTYGLPNYESVRVDLEAVLEPGEPIERALDTLAVAARIYKNERFDKGNKGPLDLRKLTDVTVTYKHSGTTVQVVGDPLEGARDLTGMKEIPAVPEEFASEDFDPSEIKR